MNASVKEVYHAMFAKFYSDRYGYDSAASRIWEAEMILGAVK